MNEEKTQIADGVASVLNAELDNRLYYVEPIAFKNNKTGKIRICRVFSWRVIVTGKQIGRASWRERV